MPRSWIEQLTFCYIAHIVQDRRATTTPTRPQLTFAEESPQTQNAQYGQIDRF